MKNFSYEQKDLSDAIHHLKSGGIILYPTDSIWGIGCDATNSNAVERIYFLKQRSDAKSMILLANSEMMVDRYVREIPEIAYQLIEVSERPITIIYPESKNLPEKLINNDGTIAFRITNENFCLELLKGLRRPIVSTSANISGMQSPGSFSDIDSRVLEGVDYVVKYRQDDFQKYRPSSIIKLGPGGEVTIIRE